MTGEPDWIRLACTLLTVVAVLLPVVRSSYWIFRILADELFNIALENVGIR